MQLLGREHGVRRWCDRRQRLRVAARHRAARRTIRAPCAREICHETFLAARLQRLAPHGRGGRALARRRRADAARRRGCGDLQPRVRRRRARRGCRRLSTLIDENTLAGSGAENTRGICAAAAYFETLATPESLDFGWRYTRRFGLDAPTLNSVGESCYEGIVLLSALARRAGSLDVHRMTAAAESLSYAGPRGEVQHAPPPPRPARLPGRGPRLQLEVVAQL